MFDFYRKPYRNLFILVSFGLKLSTETVGFNRKM